MVLHLDAVGGVAGDMFIAAITDAFPDLREGMLAAVRSAGLPEAIDCRFEPHTDGVLTGSQFVVDIPHNLVQQLFRAQHHTHRDFAELRAHLLDSDLAIAVKQRAVAIFTVLAEAEAKVHGVSIDQVSFHELGEWDSIADIVGAAYVIETLGAQSWTVSTLPMGSGFVATAHGKLPIPTPATAIILEGYAMIDDGVQGERVTPTGAAILRNLRATQKRDSRTRTLRRTGHGFGTKVFPGLSNVLRVLEFELAESNASFGPGDVAMIQFEVDDQTAEDLAIALDHLRAHPSVFDVMQSSVFGKKGRVAAQIQVLADPGALDAVAEACFLETTTIGLRYQIVSRKTLPRDIKRVQVGHHIVRVKVAQRGEVATAKAESDDTLNVASHDARVRLRQTAETTAKAQSGNTPNAESNDSRSRSPDATEASAVKEMKP